MRVECRWRGGQFARQMLLSPRPEMPADFRKKRGMKVRVDVDDVACNICQALPCGGNGCSGILGVAAQVEIETKV